MLRGVNKKIIEVVDTQSEYFERAILFVKDCKLGSDEGVIKKHADGFLKGAGAHRLRLLMYGRPVWEACKLLLAVGAGYLLALFLPGIL